MNKSVLTQDDWDKAKAHLVEVRRIAEASMGVPGANVVFYLRGVYKIEKRLKLGERTDQLFEAIMELH